MIRAHEETIMLGVPLPAIEGEAETWIPRADVAAPVTWVPPPPPAGTASASPA